jgi:uncharacterized ferritin-like protein (DUF455 family)
VEAETVEAWAFRYLTSEALAHKLSPPPPPERWEARPRAQRIARPGRPEVLIAATQRIKSPRPGALKAPVPRARLIHGFLHHELQAAELMCWAILAFPDAPAAMKRGWLGIALDELRHMAMYEAHLIALGHRFGSFPINDWFWTRVPESESPAAFVATLGMGLEGGNLDHAQRFTARLLEAGDPEAAAIEARIGEEEVPHVAFAIHWFDRLTGGCDFEVWRAHLVAPLSPMMMRGDPINFEARRRAGFPEAFLEELSRWSAGS